MNDYPENDTANHCALCDAYKNKIAEAIATGNLKDQFDAQDALARHLKSHERAAVEWRGGVKWVEVRR